jgi:hypothetical protein
MAQTVQTRHEELIVAWRRDATGTLQTYACLIDQRELYDDVARTYEPLDRVPAATINVSDVVTVIGDQLPALTAERDGLQAQIAQMTADHQAALQSAADDKAAALQAAAADKAAALQEAAQDKASALQAAADAQTQALAAAAADKEAALSAAATAQTAAVQAVQTQLDAANARIAELTAPPVVPVVDMVQFKLALLETASFLNAGKTLLDDANALVAGSPANVQLLWSAAKVARDNAVLNQMAPLLVPAGQNPGAVLDQLFVLAATQQG